MDWMYLFTSTEGRIGRLSYWMGVVAIAVITLVSIFVDVFLGTISDQGYGLVSSIVSLIMIFPSIMLYAKRWHDRDKSGWWTLIILVPVIGSLWMLIECGFLKGTDGPNRFGPDPLSA